MNWISVKDKLPEKGSEVLVYAKEYFCEGYLIISAFYGKHYYSKELKFSSIFGVERVSHWMPLPEPPKDNTYELD